MNITKKIITHEEEKCISDGQVYISNPPQYKCSKCGQFWFVKDSTPVCKNVEINTVFEEDKREERVMGIDYGYTKEEKWVLDLQSKFFLGNQFTPEFEDTLKVFIHSLLEERTNEIIDLAISLRKELTYRPIDEMSYKEKMEEMHAIGWNQGLEEFTAKLREKYL